MGHTAHSDLPRKHMNDKWLKWWWSGLSASLKWRMVTRRPPTTGPTTQHAMSVSELPVEDEEEPGQCEVAATWDKQDQLKRLGKLVNIVRYTFLLTVMASNLLLFIEFLDGKHRKNSLGSSCCHLASIPTWNSDSMIRHERLFWKLG